MIEQHIVTYIEEANELLAELETSLLELEENPTDENIDRQGFPCHAHHQGFRSDVRF